MQQPDDQELCRRHQQRCDSSKLLRTAYICVNRFCANAFELGCLRCKNELHKDHSMKYITLENFKMLLAQLSKEDRKGAGEFLDMYRRYKLIKEFRRKMQLIEADLGSSVGKLTACVEGAKGEEAAGLKEIIGFVTGFDEILRQGELREQVKAVGKYIDYNAKKDIMELSSAKLKEHESERRKQLEMVRRQLEETKEYSMKIIEVVLHQPESDDEEQPSKIMKLKHLLPKANSAGESLEIIKDGIAEIVADIAAKNEELRNWVDKAISIDPAVDLDLGCVPRDQSALQEVEKLTKEKAGLIEQTKARQEEVDDLKKKMARMADRDKKRSDDEEKNRLKHQLQIIKNSLTQKEAARAALEIRIKDIEDQLQQTAVQNQMLLIQKAELQTANQTLYKTNAVLSAQTAELKEKSKNFEDNISKLNNSLAASSKQAQSFKDTILKQTKKNEQLQRQCNTLGDKLDGIVTRSQYASQKWKTLNDSKTQTISKLTQKCKDLIQQTRRRVQMS